MDLDVTVDRDSYIGGSDVPIIMGISSFKTRYELLLEKAGLKTPDFAGNKYTVYGQQIEPQIRDYINSKKPEELQFVPNRTVKGDFRSHTDGFNGVCVLEIKSTSHIYETVDEYKVYLVQLIKYMEQNEVTQGMLAVYERPEDFDTEFDPTRLTVFNVEAEKYTSLLAEINYELDRFRADLKRLKENPLLSEEDFQPSELVALSNKVLEFENRLAEYKAIEQQYKDMKQKLFDAMLKHDVKSWQTVNGVRITRVDATEPVIETVTEFDVDSFKEEHADLYAAYCREVEKRKAKRSGFVKITLPKT